MERSRYSENAEQNILESNSESVGLEKNENIKNNLKNALVYCKYLLEVENLLTNAPTQISTVFIAMGEEIFKEIMFVLKNRKIITDEDLIRVEDIN